MLSFVVCFFSAASSAFSGDESSTCDSSLPSDVSFASFAGAGSAGLDRILSIFAEDISVVMAQIGVKGIYEIDNSVLARSQE